MGCGCKNKVQGQVQQPVNQPSTQQTQTTNNNQTVLESVKQTIEKYYQANKSK
jgi:DNA-binding protein Fis